METLFNQEKASFLDVLSISKLEYQLDNEIKKATILHVFKIFKPEVEHQLDRKIKINGSAVAGNTRINKCKQANIWDLWQSSFKNLMLLLNTQRVVH